MPPLEFDDFEADGLHDDQQSWNTRRLAELFLDMTHLCMQMGLSYHLGHCRARLELSGQYRLAEDEESDLLGHVYGFGQIELDWEKGIDALCDSQESHPQSSE